MKVPVSDSDDDKGKRKPPTLMLTVGPQEMVGKTWTLNKKSFTIGRFAASEIQIPEGSLSKAHARIQITDGIASIADLDATNGTSVNGKKLTPFQSYQLRHNDQIKAGSVVFKFLDKLRLYWQSKITEVSRPSRRKFKTAPPLAKASWICPADKKG